MSDKNPHEDVFLAFRDMVELAFSTDTSVRNALLSIPSPNDTQVSKMTEYNRKNDTLFLKIEDLGQRIRSSLGGDMVIDGVLEELRWVNADAHDVFNRKEFAELRDKAIEDLRAGRCEDMDTLFGEKDNAKV